MAAATPFTTWTALYQAMLNALADAVASGAFKAVSYSINGKQVQYRSIDDLRKGIEWAKSMADYETGSAHGRTYAKNGGGGRW
ncbi:hypothetical protein KJ039_07205 [bacterium]|nr:hypothetical protein [bacterium]